MRVRELAERLGATFEGDGEKDLRGAASVEDAGGDELAFIGSRKAARQFEASAAGCLIVPFDLPNPGGRTMIRAAEPRLAFARAIALLYPAAPPEPGIHPTAVIAAGAEIAPGATIGPHVSIGDETRIGANVRIGAGCAIGRRGRLGCNCLLHARVTIYDDVEIGDNVVLHSGCVIGADGFGFVLTGERYEKFQQIGRVVIEDDVEIGANSCVDRAALGVTFIGQGTKLDNLVHVAHNCRLGRHVVVAAQTGFSGSVVVEDYAVIGGQVGIGDKARIGSRAVLGSKCGILSSKVVRPGQVLWGIPARPLKEHLEQLASLARLPAMRRELAELKRRLQEIVERGS